MTWFKVTMRDSARVVIDGLMALIRNWPVLLAVFLSGYIVRMGALWLAGVVISYSTTVAAMILPFAPLAMMVSLVVMLRVVARSFSAELWEDRTETVSAQVRAIIIAVLPFLAIYVSNGFLRDDMRRYAQDQTGVAFRRFEAGDIFNGGLFDRAIISATGLLLGIAVVALILRKVIVWRGLTENSMFWVIVSTYIEVLWMTSLGFIFVQKLGELQNWVFTRQATENIVYWWNEASGWYAILFVQPFKYLASFVIPFTSLIIVPVAWLAVGATIYGSSLPEGTPLLNPEAMTKRIAKIPNPVRRTVGHVIEPVVTPVRASVTAVRKIAVAGLEPMILFCVIFALAGWLRIGVRWLFHLLLGPRPEELVFALEPFAALLDSAVYFLVVITLVVAAVNRVVVEQQRLEAADVA